MRLRRTLNNESAVPVILIGSKNFSGGVRKVGMDNFIR